MFLLIAGHRAGRNNPPRAAGHGARVFCLLVIIHAGILNSASLHANQAQAPLLQEKRAVAEELMRAAEKLRAEGTDERLRAAIEKYQSALSVWRELRDLRQEGLTLLALAQIYNDLDESDEALRYLPQALSLTTEHGTPENKATVYKLAAIIYSRVGRVDEAIDYALLALPLFRAFNDKKSEANILINVGGILLSEGKTQDADEYFKQAQEVWRGVNNRREEAALLNSISKICSAKREPQKAIQYTKLALGIWQSLAERREEAFTLNNLGLLYQDAGEGYTGIEHLTKASEMLRALKETEGVAIALENIGLILDDLGEKYQAIKHLTEAVQLWKSLKDEASEGKARNDLGFVYATTGEYQKALSHYQQALTLRRAARDQEGEATTLHNIAGIYAAVNDEQNELVYLNQARHIYHSIGDPTGEANTLNTLASLYEQKGDKQKALELYELVLRVFRIGGDRRAQSSILSSIASIHASSGNKEKALEYYEEALTLSREAQDFAQEGTVLTNIGTFYIDNNEKPKALEYFSRALVLAQRMGEPRQQAYTLVAIGNVHYGNGDFSQALNFYQQSIDILEKARAAVRIEEFKTKLADQSSNVYQVAAALSLKLNRPEQVFELSERARARTFLDQVGNGNLDVTRGADEQLIRQQQTLRIQLSDLRQRLNRQRMLPAGQRDGKAIQEINSQLAGKMREYEELLIRIKATSPGYDSLISVSPLSLATVQKLLDKDTTLVSYFTLDSNAMLAFLITKDSFQPVELRVGERELSDAVAQFRGFPNREEAQPKVFRRLYEVVFKPLRQYIRTQTVGIVPHGVLHYLPFAALLDEQGYLGASYSFFYLPSVSALQFVKQNRKAGDGNRMLALAQGTADGLPFLQYARTTTEEVAKLYKAKALTNSEATELALRANAGTSNILFLAAHGKLNAASPLFSNIVLSPDKVNDGSLEVHEVYGLDLGRTNLVVLSACQTQLGRGGAGDDLVGLNRAFIYAGAPTVLASLWSVPERQTGELMLSFFRHLKGGKSKAEALSAAQAEVRKEQPNPYYWAAFILTGDAGTAGR